MGIGASGKGGQWASGKGGHRPSEIRLAYFYFHCPLPHAHCPMPIALIKHIGRLPCVFLIK
ncbi:hypothetical protein [Tolypothrix sp. VBCCA 56010]|uniref:hypothetical protein n=1 Tax=Tolypothrix sp. VBCCA 56010 TaxID=3137731 RepID=UPI003D7CF16B